MHNNNNYQCKMCWCWFDKTQFSYHCVHPIHAKMFSIQILLHFSQIVPRVCTLVLFIFGCSCPLLAVDVPILNSADVQLSLTLLGKCFFANNSEIGQLHVGESILMSFLDCV